MATKRRIPTSQAAPVPVTDPLEDLMNDLEQVDEPIAEIPVGPSRKIAKRNKDFEETKKQGDKKNAYHQLRHALTSGVCLGTSNHFPDVPLGRNKQMSAKLSPIVGKTKFYFRSGLPIEDNASLIELSESGLNMLLAHASPFIAYIEEWENLKHRAEKEKIKVSEDDQPPVPSNVILDTTDNGQQIVLAPFKYKDQLGGGVTIKISEGTDKDGSMSPNKQFGIAGVNFQYLINAHIPFFRSAYKAYSEMLNNLALHEGVPVNRNATLPSWKD